MEPVPQGWAGVDVGKGHHWVCLIDEDGTTLWSGKVISDETAILGAISQVRARADQVTWAVDVTGTMSGLLLALLAAHDETVKYVPGRVVNKMADTYPPHPPGDARDAGNRWIQAQSCSASSSPCLSATQEPLAA